MASPQWIGWQLLDSAFPSGGFAHSAGLETAFQAGLVPDAGALAAFARDALTQSAFAALPLVIAAFRQPERFSDLDRDADAALVNHVANRTSRAQGRALLHAAEAVYALPAFNQWMTPIRAGDTPGHLAPVFGVVTRTLDLTEPDARLLFLYLQLRTIVSAAVRLGVVGPMAGQKLQHELASHAQQLAAAPRDEQTWQTLPVADMLQAAQDRLYSRLFQS